VREASVEIGVNARIGGIRVGHVSIVRFLCTFGETCRS
jgi:hypothetical protein